MSLHITLYSKTDCHLCEEVCRILDEMAREFDFEIEVVDITSQQALFERFRYWIPVVDIGEGPLLYPPITEERLRAALRNSINAQVGHD